MSEDKTDEMVAIVERYQKEATDMIVAALIEVTCHGVHPNDLERRASPVEKLVLGAFFGWYAATYPEETPSRAKH